MSEDHTREYVDREPDVSIARYAKDIEPADLRAMFSNVRFKTRPFDHQLRALMIGMSEDTFLFALDMGTGKTKIALDIISCRKAAGDITKTLVICPPVVVSHWAEQVKRHSDLTCVEVKGDAMEKRERLFNSQADLIIVSYAWLTMQFAACTGDRERAAEMREFASGLDCVIIDEAHQMKNASGKGSRGVRRFLSGVRYRYLMTGTPVGNRMLEVWALYAMLDGGEAFGASYRQFLATWFDRVDVGGKRKFPLYSLRKETSDEFQVRFWRRAVRWEQSECNDLPERTYTELPVDMTAEQREAYRDALQNPDSKRDVASLMRITAGVDLAASPKMEALRMVVADAVDGGRCVIVWHWLRAEGEMIVQQLTPIYGARKVRAVRGDVSDKEKAQALEAWHKGRVRVLVANPKSLGIGVDLVEANYAVFFSNHFSLIDRKQAEKRIHRTGQSCPCFYFDLFCRGTVDELALAAVRESDRRFCELTGDALWRAVEEQQLSI